MLLRRVALDTLSTAAPRCLLIAFVTLPFVSSLAFRSFDCECFEDGRSYLTLPKGPEIVPRLLKSYGPGTVTPNAACCRRGSRASRHKVVGR